MGSYFSNPLQFVIDTMASLYVAALLLRFLLQWVRADAYNPLAQFLIRITHPPLKILRRFVPSVGRLDTSSLVLAFLLQLAAQWGMLNLAGLSVSPVAYLILTLTQLIALLFSIYTYAILLGAVLSWVAMGNYSPLSALIYSLTEPLLRICRSILPNLGMVDLSPLLALFLLQLAKMMVLPPLADLALLLG